MPGAEGLLDPERLGRAAPNHDPQQIKKVWHLLARYGRVTHGFAC